MQAIFAYKTPIMCSDIKCASEYGLGF